MSHELNLDDKIRDWVLIPIFIFQLLLAMLRHYTTQLTKSEMKADVEAVKEGQLLKRAKVLRMSAGLVTERSFKMRKHYMNNDENGALKAPAGAAPQNPFASQNPEQLTGMVDMMKGNLTYLVPNMVMMGAISYFFSGFVIAKIPFPLSLRFKGMLQRGLELDSLDVTYVSSLSWYFLVMFGLRGLTTLLLGEGSAGSADEMAMAGMGMPMGPGGGMPGMGQPGQDKGKLFTAEKDNLELVKHKFLLNDAERRLLNNRR